MRRLSPSPLRWAATALMTAGVTALSTTSLLPASAADPNPADPAPVATAGDWSAGLKGAPEITRDPSHRTAVFVRFSGQSAASAGGITDDGHTDAAAVRARQSEIRAQARSMKSKSGDAGATLLFTTTNAVPGAGLRVDADGAATLAARSDVISVTPIVPKTATNANAAALVKALASWRYQGATGKGVRIGIIDTGVDYTHADFGGIGTPNAYDDALADSAASGWRQALPAAGKAKIIGGHDFVGDDYNADPNAANYQPIPHPDANPLDCGEHGTHVAGTAAGYGVTAGGDTFTGDYPSLTKGKLMRMKVGPGMAPDAKIYAMKVFGCGETSTDEVIPALDWSLDPNGDGDFADHLDVLNLSLGSNYGAVDDPENIVIDKLTGYGVLSVISMGNNGDLTDTGGSPGNAVSSLAVASSVDSYQLRDGLKVEAPGDVAGIEPGQFSIAYDWAGNGPTGQPVTGDVAQIPGDNADGCDPLSPADAALVNGKVAWLEWDDNDATRECGSAARSGHVKAAGAIGAVFTSGLSVFGAGITGDPDIPVFQLPKEGTDRLRPAAAAGTLRVTFDGQYAASIKDVNPAITDTISTFTSRGPHGSIGVVKPDVAAPGDTIASAGMGSGNGTLVFSGTSMAAPTTTGVSALVMSMHPNWSPLQVKSAVMNTANHDLYADQGQTGPRYAPARVGAGRIDARQAMTTRFLVAAKGPGNAVSASFGVVPAPVTKATVTRTRTIVVSNVAANVRSVDLSYEAINQQPGVRYSVSPQHLTVPGGGQATAKVTMTVTPTKLRRRIDPTMERRQLDLPRQFLTDASGRLLVKPDRKPALRVPVYGAAKPVSSMKATADGTTIALSGRRVAQGGEGPSSYNSLVSVLQYGGSSRYLPSCAPGQTTGCILNRTHRGGDIHHVGAAVSDSWLWFGISTFGDWANVGNQLVPYVDVDVDDDGTYDYEISVATYPDTDLLLATTLDLATGDTVDLEPINFNGGDVDTNVFDTNVALLPVDMRALHLPTGNSVPITYRAAVWDPMAGSDVDVAPKVRFDVAAPTVSTADPLYLDRPSSIPVQVTGTDPAKALVLHLHNGTGARDEVVTLTP